MSMLSITPLRVVTQRLSSTPSKQLPHVAPILAGNITECRKIFDASQVGSLNKNSSENGTLIHKLKTQISALLQDKAPEARYAAVLLIKATVEVGNYDILQGSGPWVRGLIAILGRPDRLSMKKLCIIALTRIFLLTHDHQSLVREITTPTMAGFISTCINLAQESTAAEPLRLVILRALAELISLHPTLFRPFVTQLQKLTLFLIAPTPSDTSSEINTSPVSVPVSDSAREVFVLLHVCSPRNTAGEEWAQSFRDTVVTTQRTADRVFRGIIEDWRCPTNMVGSTHSVSVSDELSDHKPGPLPLSNWTGIHAGIERLDGLLRTLQAFLATPTSAPVTLPISSVIDVVDRVLTAAQICSKSSRSRPDIGRNEREGLAAGIPQLCISAMALLSLVMSRVGSGSAALVHTGLEQILWVLEDEKEVDVIRLAVYQTVAQVLKKCGPSLPKPFAVTLSQCLILACEDLLPLQDGLAHGGEASSTSEKQPGFKAFTANADSYLKSPGARGKIPNAPPAIQAAARELLILALTSLPNGFLSDAVRNQIDRTAILIKDKDLMLGSVMNTQTSGKGQRTMISILPLLTKAHPECLEVEALLRPQLPLLQPKRTQEGSTVSDKDEDLYNYEDRLKGSHTGLLESDFGSNRNDLARKDHSEPENGILRAISEAPIGASVAPLRSPEHIPAITNNSRKRVLEDDVSSNVQTGGSDVATLGSGGPTEVTLSGKRARFTHDRLEPENVPQDGLPAIPQVDTQVSSAAIPKSSISEAVGATGAQFDIEQAGSDESDFEMPTLHLGPDSDEEDDDEEGEEDEDEEDDAG